jgi:hypothetical protein
MNDVHQAFSLDGPAEIRTRSITGKSQIGERRAQVRGKAVPLPGGKPVSLAK